MQFNFDGGHAIQDTVANLYGPGVLASLPELCGQLFGKTAFVVVSDERIWSRVEGRLRPFLEAEPGTALILLPAEPKPYASEALVAEVRERMRGSQESGTCRSLSEAVPIAVGSGTINDIVKRSSFELGRRYICVPTAPSVDGFSSFGAAITVGGFKVTLECPAPLGIVADEDILVEAPGELISAGFGDLVAKLTAGADWIIADALGVEAIDRAVWEMAQAPARDILGRARGMRGRERGAIAALYKGLAYTGFAMQRYRDSRPVSGTEHLLSHFWEMAGAEGGGSSALHGFKVALGTLFAAALMEELFSPRSETGGALAARDFAPDTGLLERRLSQCASEFPDGPLRAMAESAVRAKTLGPEGSGNRPCIAREAWASMRRAVAFQVPPFAALKDALRDAGCPVEPEDIGLDREACRRALELASLIRSRYTVLDLAAELGVLGLCVQGALSRRYFSRFRRD
ncbi:MAG: sn-glycerol-1-phosphate dehydrogenase, partial [Spirochaetaceae bacterium]|nr:sn-glycerol-1-phosphate dehydrogenase [Spirochaetaceae bacterium]